MPGLAAALDADDGESPCELEANVDELLHLADRVDPEVVDVIQKNPSAVPSFLRSAKDLSPEEWEKMQNYLTKEKEDKQQQQQQRLQDPNG